MTKENIYIEENDRNIYKKMGIFKKGDWKDHFLFAMAWGFKRRIYEPLGQKKDIIFKTSYFNEDDEVLLKAVAIHHKKKSLEILDNMDEIYSIAEGYANAGINLMNRKRKETVIGSFEKKIEKELIETLENIMEQKEIGSVDYYLKNGESSEVEFKSSLRWDINENTPSKILPKIICKSIAGFFNSNGGTLLIGVNDDLLIYGIENDINSFKRKDRDGFEQFLIQMITNYLGAQFSKYLKIRYEEKNNKEICIIDIDPSPKPVFLIEKDQKKFYIRAMNTTRELDVKDTHEYIEMHWKN